MPISPPKGTRDFYPRDMAFREFLFGTWTRTCRRYGFEAWDGPVFEHLDIYTRKSGAEIEKQLYSFTDKGGRECALRPEMTPSLARMVAARGQSLKMPLRWYTISRLFRYERMQKGRLREFFQLNMDILGIKEASADAELIAAVIDVMRDLGFDTGDFTVHISSRALLEELFLAAGLAQEKLGDLYALLDRRAKMEPEAFRQQLVVTIPDETVRAEVNRVLCIERLEDIARIAPESPRYADLQCIFRLLDEYGMRDFVSFDMGVVRGLAYYTGTVFEVFDKRKSMRAIAGGGRYDHLVKQYGGPDMPAVGFAFGDVVLGDLMREKEIAPPPSSRAEVFVVTIGAQAGAVPIAREIRENGISCEFALKKANVGKQLKQAHAAGARWVLFAGGEEEAAGKIKIKDMADGNEQVIDRTKVVAFLRNKA